MEAWSVRHHVYEHLHWFSIYLMCGATACFKTLTRWLSCLGRGFSLRSYPGGESQQASIVFACSDQLHAAGRLATVEAGNGDGGHSRHADGRCVAQQARPSLAVIRPALKTQYRTCGKQQQLMLGKERVHSGAKGLMSFAQYSDGLSAQARAPFETLANGIFEVLVVALMDEGSFRGLDGCEDFDGLCPPCNIDLDSGQAERFKLR